MNNAGRIVGDFRAQTDCKQARGYLPSEKEMQGGQTNNSKVDGADFDEFVVDVAASAKKNGLTDAMIARVGALLNSLKTTVVQR